MAPSVVLKLRPAGSAGLIDQLTTAPPPTVGVSVELATDALKVKAAEPYDTLDGGASFTTIVTVADALPPVPVAETV
jgi:hypothetical protein